MSKQHQMNYCYRYFHFYKLMIFVESLKYVQGLLPSVKMKLYGKLLYMYFILFFVCSQLSDAFLWQIYYRKQLYSRVFDMRKPLRRTEEGLIVSQESNGTLSWKESFRMLHNAHHVYQNNCFQENNILVCDR